MTLAWGKRSSSLAAVAQRSVSPQKRKASSRGKRLALKVGSARHRSAKEGVETQ